ncbi:MAG: RNA-binding S4 domain-containing protein [Clostridia bacterium]|nr:MAG: RNA-binding S4 domain-containing protein [Clostridia bacterium]
MLLGSTGASRVSSQRRERQKIAVNTPWIRLDSFLKWAGAVTTGGQAKATIAFGEVMVNGIPENRRSRKLRAGDVVTVPGVGEWQLTGDQEGDGCAPDADSP